MSPEKRRNQRLELMLSMARNAEMVALKHLAVAQGTASQARGSARRIDALLGGMDLIPARISAFELEAGGQLMDRLFTAEFSARQRVEAAESAARAATQIHLQATARKDRLVEDRQALEKRARLKAERREADDQGPKGKVGQ